MCALKRALLIRVEWCFPLFVQITYILNGRVHYTFLSHFVHRRAGSALELALSRASPRLLCCFSAHFFIYNLYVFPYFALILVILLSDHMEAFFCSSKDRGEFREY